MKNKKGFTLLELIVTIIIIAILAIAATIVYKEYIKKSYESEGWALLSQIQTVQKVYYSGYNVFAGQEEIEKEVDASSNKYFTSFTVDGGGTQAWTAITDGINEADGISLTMVGSANGSVASGENGGSESDPVVDPSSPEYTNYVNQLLVVGGYNLGYFYDHREEYDIGSIDIFFRDDRPIPINVMNILGAWGANSDDDSLVLPPDAPGYALDPRYLTDNDGWRNLTITKKGLDRLLGEEGVTWIYDELGISYVPNE